MQQLLARVRSAPWRLVFRGLIIVWAGYLLSEVWPLTSSEALERLYGERLFPVFLFPPLLLYLAEPKLMRNPVQWPTLAIAFCIVYTVSFLDIRILDELRYRLGNPLSTDEFFGLTAAMPYLLSFLIVSLYWPRRRENAPAPLVTQTQSHAAESIPPEPSGFDQTAAIETFLQSAKPGQAIVLSTLIDLMTRAQQRAFFVLIGIIMLLISGVLVIAFAGQITELDLLAGNPEPPSKTERDAKQREVDNL
ncbi:MAG: hypothetical protein AAF401_17955, partial [Pseudomonadota bacterium]